MGVEIGNPGDFGLKVADICNFYNEHWPRKIALADKTFYQWQFINTPVNGGIDECCVAITGNEIVGVMGLNARKFYAETTELNGAELTTWVVSEQHRNKGSGPAMIEYLKKKFDVMTGMGISNAALPVYLRSGFRYIKSIPRHVHILNWDNVADIVEATPLAKKYAKSQIHLQSFNIKKSSPDEIERIYNEFKKNHHSFSRDSRNIKWRYDENPYFDYHHFIVNDTFHVCIRIDNSINGLRMAHCVDIFGATTDYRPAISAAISYAKDQGADAIDFFSTNATLNANLNASGLFSTLDHDFFKFPHLFHPIEIRTPATTSLIIWCKDGLSDLLDTSKLHITKQDADFDRPTMSGMTHE